ncbi:hypothetical protein [Rhodococcus sp. H29-C3]|uniref:hypothetical protein n=1 Tax=Rhodococcus sp. H29-C3 TaxID=3046307 RepID=UPI0024BA763E|nr:hypothetical protein [Rhodococcus sp. H29-C3]MDJ0360693.1 hypothetical protein [Rhodococcus sp. H29-C3]
MFGVDSLAASWGPQDPPVAEEAELREDVPISTWRALAAVPPGDEVDRDSVARALSDFVASDGTKVPAGALVERTSGLYLDEFDKFD